MTTQAIIDYPAPDFLLLATNGKEVQLLDFKEKKNVVLYFYPKDCTPGCTREGQDFRDYYEKFAALDAVIFGISRDTLQLHQKFKTEEQFPFELLSDTHEEVCKLYDVIKDKTMYGKQVRGVERSTFLIDKQGVLRHVWRNVKVEGHVGKVLEALEKLS